MTKFRIKKYLNESHLGLLFGIIAFSYFFYNGLTKEEINSANDLIELKGNYISHSFKDNVGYKNSGHQYYLWIQSYDNAFQIKADYLRLFNLVDFVLGANQDNEVVITIPRYQMERLNSTKNIFITSIKINGISYLSKRDVLKKEKELLSSKSDYIIGIGYLIGGLFIYYRKK